MGETGSASGWVPALLRQLVLAGLIAALGACSGADVGRATGTLRVGVLPDEDEAALRERYGALFAYLADETALRYELIMPQDYAELLALFAGRRVDLAYFGGLTFVKAHAEYGAVPLVMRDVDTRFTSLLLVADPRIDSFEGLRGKSLGFGAELSTSGHLMPRHFLKQLRGIEPEAHFGEVRYSGQHDRTVYWVRDGEVDAGVANAQIVRAMLADGRVDPSRVRVLWETPPYPNYVWAAHPEVPPAVHRKVRQAFLKLSLDDARHRALLTRLDANSFYPAGVRDFAALRSVMKAQEML